MTIKEQQITLAQAVGFSDIKHDPLWRNGTLSGVPEEYPFGYRNTIPDYHIDLNEIAAARKKLITTPKLKYTYTNHIRDIIAKKPETPKNKAGQALVSDYDCVNAEPEEHLEAIVKTLKIWKD